MRVLKPTFEIEALNDGHDYVIGVDEVGRGAIAGPVMACACVLKREFWENRSKEKEFAWKKLVRDSKTLSEVQREAISPKIIEMSVEFGLGQVESDEIDDINIHNASLLAMRLAVGDLINKLQMAREAEGDVSGLKFALLIDGKFGLKDFEIVPHLFAQQTIVDGDAKALSIAAASIIAKTHRDQMLRELDLEKPDYGFAKHKGYGTKSHFAAIIKHGLLPVHRRSFIKI